jgi:hypothetical protein
VEQYANPCFFQHKCIKDLVYSGINASIIKAFLASQKIKGNGKMASFSHTLGNLRMPYFLERNRQDRSSLDCFIRKREKILKLSKRNRWSREGKGILTRMTLILLSFLFIITLPK